LVGNLARLREEECIYAIGGKARMKDLSQYISDPTVQYYAVWLLTASKGEVVGTELRDWFTSGPCGFHYVASSFTITRNFVPSYKFANEKTLDCTA
jgi:hypothetical protein